MGPGKPEQRLSLKAWEAGSFLAQLEQQALHVCVSWQRVLQNKGMEPWGLPWRRGFALRNIRG